MSFDRGRYERAIARFDAEHGADPERETIDGAAEPAELVYARRMSAMLERFAPGAPEAVRLAARCQHIRRWEIPRSSYPETPAGYKAWRSRQLEEHALLAAAILRESGYDEGTVARVASLVRKEALKRNAETQLLEDVVALVFFEHYLEGFVARHAGYGEAKLADIVGKTARKMSPEGRAAGAGLALPQALAPLVRRVIAA